MRLAGKVALISGGARGMGAAEAHLFTREGARVVIGDVLDAEGKAVEAAVTAKGGECVYVLRTNDAEADRVVRSLWRVGTQGGPARQLTRGQADSSPAWSPDGARLAFVRAADGPAQLWLLPADGGEPVQVTTLPSVGALPIHGVGSAAWRKTARATIASVKRAPASTAQRALRCAPCASSARPESRTSSATAASGGATFTRTPPLNAPISAPSSARASQA